MLEPREGPPDWWRAAQVSGTEVYAAAAREYLSLGWAPIPLPPGEKSPPPTGFTGRGAPYPSGADVEAWCEDKPDHNVGLRMPPGVLGIDVDNYGDKRGGDTRAALEAARGSLPAT
jgi:Bifunctional DNA primase/polymerase, N-terminal